MTAARPHKHLRMMKKRYRGFSELTEQLVRRRGVGGTPSWPDWCFLPFGGWHTLMGNYLGDSSIADLRVAYFYEAAMVAAIGTWQYSQGIYRFDPTLLSALKHSRLEGDLPADALLHLPEWCIYIETPGWSWMGEPLFGFWAHLEWDINTGGTELRFLLDGKSHLVPHALPLGAWSLKTAVGTLKEVVHLRLSEFDVGSETIAITEQLMPLVSLLLYLCSEEPEIDEMRQPGCHSSRANPRPRPHGRRFFVPDQPRQWVVGRNVGEALRASANVCPIAEGCPRRTVTTHLRRGHWHGFWTGPRTGERKFVYRWIPPLVVEGRKVPEAA
ncbi:hypothetical protein [Pseudomonas sp. D(2018)]|uniref:AcrVA2 family anti-CRISPR protein n=1 Tax=Pseudomonas sp. D(2018) TaxID=2502238 RepID=UPI0010F63251|nr:hypothetical protein [Pseudomonas sp. D(2018)]